jgi:hypothetical protein
MTTMTKPIVALLLVSLVSACRSTREQAPAPPEPPSIDVTIWSERTELFMEYPPLVAGEQARFAIHLTDLSNFTPLREGKVVVRFEGDAITTFEVNGPTTPGIFGVDVKVPAARRYQVAVEVHRPQFTDELRVGPVTVYADQKSAVAAIAAREEGATSFLKEQQWTLDFRTMKVDSQRRGSAAAPRCARRRRVALPRVAGAPWAHRSRGAPRWSSCWSETTGSAKRRCSSSSSHRPNPRSVWRRKTSRESSAWRLPGRSRSGDWPKPKPRMRPPRPGSRSRRNNCTISN